MRTALQSTARALAVAAVLAASAAAQDRRASLDVESYRIQASIDPAQQSLAAKAEVTFLPLDDRIQTAAFELNNALNLAGVTDSSGQPLQTTRSAGDFTVRVNF